MTSPKFVRASLALVAPVPPLVMARVPAMVMEPLLVIGPPENVMPVEPPATLILVTVPEVGVVQLVFVPSVWRALFAFPDWEGSNAFNAAVAVVWPVPPFAIGSEPVTFVVRSMLPANIAFVTTLLAMVVVKLPVPDPVTFPVRVMVWSPVLVPLRLLPETLPEAEILPDAATEPGVMLPKVKVIAGVVVAFATLPLTPFAVVTETLVTEPVAAALQPVFVPSV